MPESRDRRPHRTVDISEVYTRRQSGPIFLDDDNDNIFGSPSLRPTPTPLITNGFQGMPMRGIFGNHTSGSPFPASAVRNTPPPSSSRSVLPSWYPRTPLRDITALHSAMERRRVRLGENQNHQPMSPSLVEETPAKTPIPTTSFKLRTPAGSKLPKLLHDITNQSDEGSEFITPQKKLLNSIDVVEKVMREELQKLKRTPSARKADRERRVRTLMSMR